MADRKKPSKRTLDMLADIQDIKSSFYVGTQEAWDYLTGLRKLDDRINVLVNMLNNLPYGSFPAERRHVLGAYDGVREIMDVVCSSLQNEGREDPKNGWGSLENYFPHHGNPLIDPSDEHVIAFGKDLAGGASWAAQEIATNPYNQTPFEEIFTRGVVATAINGTDLPDKQQSLAMYLASVIDHDELYSPENSMIVEKGLKEKIRRFTLRPNDITRRVLNDKIDNRLWRKREIAIAVIGDGDSNYEETLSQLQRRRAYSIDQLQRIESMDLPKAILDNAKEGIKINEYHINCLTSNKEFLQRYLAN